uniref:Small GTP-binding protein n=1 Tax=uncultured euryarchaeote Rifle_16ft_4_minimus_309 TaxID=1665192 RepID=A0A0H4T2T7_9EURY|nr:small GTP-binding protein [uncultured euryarchaeote Rifle_16ft_4_minimus_309]
MDHQKMKVKICLVGEGAVGKTCLIRRFIQDQFDDRYISTLGAKVSKKEIKVDGPNGGMDIDMTIWDIMGEKGFRELLKEAYFHGAQGVLAVCDVTRKETLEDLDDWVAAVVKVTGNIPMEYLANKYDLRDQMAVSESDIRAAAESHRAPFLFTSAKTGENVEKAFANLARIIAQRAA